MSAGEARAGPTSFDPKDEIPRVRDHERQFTEAIVQDLAASIAGDLRETADVAELVTADQQLTSKGRLFVRGFVLGRLSMVRAGVVGNPNLSTEDLEAVESTIEENESAIAAELHA